MQKMSSLRIRFVLITLALFIAMICLWNPANYLSSDYNLSYMSLTDNVNETARNYELNNEDKLTFTFHLLNKNEATVESTSTSISYGTANNHSIIDNLFSSGNSESSTTSQVHSNLKYIDLRVQKNSNTINADSFNYLFSLNYNDTAYELTYDKDMRFVDSGWLRITIPEELLNKIDYDNDLVSLTIAKKSGEDTFSVLGASNFDSASSSYLNDKPINTSPVIRCAFTKSSLSLFIFAGLLLVFTIIFCLLQNGFTMRSFILFAFMFGLLSLIVFPFPLSYESNSVLQYNFYLNHSVFTAPGNETWLPSKLINHINFNTIPSDVYSNDYASYSIIPPVGVPVIQWLLCIPLLIAKHFALNNVYSFVLLRAVAFIVCFVLNALAIGASRKVRPITFIMACIPFAFFMISSASYFGILLSVFNLFMALVFNSYSLSDGNGAELDERFGFKEWIPVLFLLFVITLQNFILGAFALCLLMSIPGASFNAHNRSRFLWTGAIIVCGSLAANVLFFIHNKEVYASTLIFTTDLSYHFQTGFINGVFYLLNVLVHSITSLFSWNIFSNTLGWLQILLVGIGTFIALRSPNASHLEDTFTVKPEVSVHSLEEKTVSEVAEDPDLIPQSPVSTDNAPVIIHGNKTKYPFIMMIAAVFAALFALLSGTLIEFSSMPVGGLLMPFFGVLSACVYCGKKRAMERRKDMILCFILMLCAVIPITGSLFGF